MRRVGKRQAQDAPLVGRESIPRFGDEPGHGFPPRPPGLHEPGQAKLAEVPRNERLAQADMIDEFADRGLALGEPPYDP